MKTCPNCGTQIDDNIAFCTNCGVKLDAYAPSQQSYTPPQQPYTPPQQPYAPIVDPTDHTAEFTSEDVHENKVFALLCYGMGVIGIVIALLAKRDSAYLNFHIKECIKLAVMEIVVGFITIVGSIIIIGGFVGGIMMIILAVVQIIGFCNCAGNKSKELPIIKGFSFLK